MDLSTGEVKDKFEEYLILKKHSYQSKGSVRIAVLKQMLAFEESGEYRGEASALDVQCSSLNAIGFELILAGHFAEADEYLLESMKRREENNLLVFSSTVQNYIGNQLNQGNYQKGIDLYNKYREEINGYRQYISICLYKAYCHLFVGRDDEALNSLPKTGRFYRTAANDVSHDLPDCIYHKKGF